MARLIEVALHRTGFPHDLETVYDGVAAIARLEQNRVVSSGTPDLVILDLYMPGKDGFEVLEHIKSHERLRRIPVVMFSSSGAAADVNRAYDLHANAYVSKDTDFSQLCATVDAILHFWLKTAVPPFEG